MYKEGGPVTQAGVKNYKPTEVKVPVKWKVITGSSQQNLHILQNQKNKLLIKQKFTWMVLKMANQTKDQKALCHYKVTFGYDASPGGKDAPGGGIQVVAVAVEILKVENIFI